MNAEECRQKGNESFSKGDFGAAIACYEEALGADGSAAVAHLVHSNLSLCFLKMFRYEEALHSAERAVALKPQWHKGWSRKAAALEALGRLQDALVAARQALTLEPQNADYRSLALSLKGKLDANNFPSPQLSRPTTCRFLPRYDPPEGKGDNLLVLLHGLGDKPFRFLEFGKRLQLPSTSVVALYAPTPLGFGGPFQGQQDGFEWYPAFEYDGELIKASQTERRRLDALCRSTELVAETLRNLWSQGGWTERTTFLLGFSQGAVVAVDVGRTQTLAGVVAISSSLLEEVLLAGGSEALVEAEASASGGGASRWRCSSETPMLLTHGRKDANIPVDVARRCYDKLAQSLGADLVTWREYDKAHEMLAQPSEVHDLMAFMAKHLTIRGPLPGCQTQGGRGREGGQGGGVFANREDLVEIRDPNVIRRVLLGGGGGDLDAYEASPV